VTSEFNESPQLPEGLEDLAEERPPFAAGFSAVVDIFHAPGKVGGAIAKGLSWWPGLIVIIVLALISSVIMSPIQGEMARMQIESAGVQGGEQVLDRAIQVAKVSAFLMPVLGAPLALLFITLFYWLALLMTFGEARFGRIFTLAVYVAPIISLFSLLNALYLRFTDPEFTNAMELAEANLNLSLGAFAPVSGSFLNGFLNQLSIPGLWTLTAFILAASMVMNKRWKSVAWPVGLVFLLGALISAGMMVLGAKISMG
jgi:hypothetical protein